MSLTRSRPDGLPAAGRIPPAPRRSRRPDASHGVPQRGRSDVHRPLQIRDRLRAAARYPATSSPMKAHCAALTPSFAASRRKVAHLVAAALHQMTNAQFPTASRDRGRAAPGDDGDRNAGARQTLHTVAILDIEGLQLLTARPVVDTPIGEHAIHIEDQQTDASRDRFARQSALLHHACAQQVVHVKGAHQASSRSPAAR